ncbi:phospholipase-like protein [Tanacetum coccineum]|uniref:Phospholipase-like protein n=1 Tax=Tanacetum coccineum TaxID=301880 RepID=A0ABQ5C1G6_9ASTR
MEQEVTKKQKVDDVQETTEVDDDQETTKIKELMKIVSDEEEVVIDAIPLATKPPTIVDWKIHKEGKKNYYQIIRADGSSKMYLVFSHMLKSFDREDLKLFNAAEGVNAANEEVSTAELVGDSRFQQDGIMKRQFKASTTSVSDEVDRADNNTLNTAPYAKDNIMPQRVYEYLGLDKLRDTSTLENTKGTNEHLGTVNILVKFGKIEFPCNFIIKMVEDVIIIGRSFIESTRAQIDVFNKEISFEISSKKFKFNIDSYQSVEKIYMVDIGQEKETFNPLEIGIDLFCYESPACLEFEQRLVKRWHVCKRIHVTYDDGSTEDCGMWPTCDPDSKFCFGYNEVFGVNEQGSLRMWICFHDHERRTMKGSYMGFVDFLQVRYGQQKIDDTTREQRYYEWVAQNYEFSKHRTLTSTKLNDHYPYNTNDPIPTPQGHREQGDDELRPIRPRPCNYSFEEWMKIRIGHNSLHESDSEFIFNEWILDSYDVEEEYAREIGDPYSKRFDEYNRVFNNEIEHLSNEYILRIGKKGYVLDDVWEKCQQNYKKINEAWHDEAYEEDKMW